MQLITFLSLLAVASTLPAPSRWSDFKKQHNKSYSSVAEEIKRAKIFLANVKLINEHNQRHKNGQVSFSLEVNKFADLTFAEFKENHTGFKGSKHLFGSVLQAKDLPDSVDWRKKAIVSPVKDQGQCGSCWAFSAVSSMESAHAQKTGKLIELSEQNLMDCSRPEGDQGCNGGLMDFAFQYVLDNKGIDTEDSYPYEGQDDSCRFMKKDIGANLTGYVNITGGDENSLETAVSKCVVSIAIEASIFLQFYEKGIYERQCGIPAQLDHGVSIVGYDSEDGKDYWIVRNSWGGDWGENGYVRMKRGENLCGLADSASYPLPA